METPGQEQDRQASMLDRLRERISNLAEGLSGTGELGAALAKAQGEIENAKRDNDNPFFRSKYADLASVWAACRAPLSKNGIAVIQATQLREGKLVLETTLLHSSGQWMRSEMPIKPAKDDLQSLGSALTYVRRYALAAMVGVAPGDDDDGEAAMGRTQDTKAREEFGTVLDKPENRTPPTPAQMRVIPPQPGVKK